MAATRRKSPPWLRKPRAADAGALGIRANVGSFAESRAMIERAQSEGGHLDILVDTPILGNFSEEALKEFSRRVPIGRIGRPEEIAEAALYFASDQSAYVTGQILNLRGGTVI